MAGVCPQGLVPPSPTPTREESEGTRQTVPTSRRLTRRQRSGADREARGELGGAECPLDPPQGPASSGLEAGLQCKDLHDARLPCAAM